MMVPFDETQSFLDDPQILQFIFYPRRENNPVPSVPNATNIMIPVDRDISIGCRFYYAEQSGPNILFFHGNGEIVSDYDFIAPLYGERGLNLFVADYRGYGFSGGAPTTSSMIHDAHPVFQHFLEFLKNNHYTGPIFVMGRSLGSASALELGSHHQDHLKGMIIESGFADTLELLHFLGIPVRVPQGLKDRIVSNREKIRTSRIPTLIIHAEKDHIIPLRHGKELYESSPAEDRQMVIIPDANHNDLMMVGQRPYFEAIVDFVSRNR
jgi:hypothetical protein